MRLDQDHRVGRVPEYGRDIAVAQLKYDFLALFPVNPQTLACYRRSLCLYRAKDNPPDAELLVDLVPRHRILGDQQVAGRQEGGGQ
jgi:hypothetical protein